MAPGAPINKIERAHQMYREGRYLQALGFYTEALSMAKTKPQKIALHSNRAACYLKLHHFNKAAEECTSVLELDHNHTGALMLRAQTLVTLKEYHSALFDVNRLIDLNPPSEVYQNLHARLKTQLSLAPIPEAEMELEEEDEDTDQGEQKEEEEEQVEGGEPEKEEEEQMGAVELEQDAVIGRNQNTEYEGESPRTEVTTLQTFDLSQKAEKVTPQNQSLKKSSEQNSSGWQTIPKPKGHSRLDYSRWDRVEVDSSEDDDDEDDEESQPQYRFRVRTVDNTGGLVSWVPPTELKEMIDGCFSRKAEQEKIKLESEEY